RHRHLNVAVAWATDLVADFRRLLAVHRNAVDGVDAIPIKQPPSPCGRMVEGRGNESLLLFADREILNSRANTEVLAALISLQFLKLFAIEITRMRVERPQHSRHRRFVDIVVVKLV